MATSTDESILIPDDNLRDIDPKLGELRPPMQQKVAAVILALRKLGYKPKISNAYRSHKTQLEKLRKGYSKSARPGTHHWGLAVDMIDRRWAWRPTEENATFFIALGREVHKHGLTWGGSKPWGFGRRGTREKPTHRSTWNRYGLGWDPAHYEWRRPPHTWRKEYNPKGKS